MNWTSSNTTVATVSHNGEVTAVGTTTITVTTQDGNKTATCMIRVNEANNLVINGVRWADINVDDYQTFAVRPDMYTKFYQWNLAKAWPVSGTVTGWTQGVTDLMWTINPCPDGWRLPTLREFEALHITGYRWANANDKGNAVAGMFYGPQRGSCTLSDNMIGCIFLPAVGARIGGELTGIGTIGYYWSSTSSGDNYGQSLSLSNANYFPSDTELSPKSFGCSIRCVRSETNY